MSKEKAVGRHPTLASRIRAALTPFASVGVAAVVLRAFLGGTLLYSGLDKFIFDPRFLQADGVGSIGDTLRFFVTAGGPLAPLVEAVALPQPVAIGVAMAFAQLLVGGSLLSGAWVRIGALLGAGISLTLALTASWGISPYYLGNDLPYLIGFLVLAALGDGGALRVGAPAQRGYDPGRRAVLASGASIFAVLFALVLLDRTRLSSILTGGSASSGSPSPSSGPSTSPEPSTSSPATAGPSASAPASSKPTQAPSPSSTPSASSGGGSAAGTVINGGKGLGSGQALNFSAGGTDAVLLKDGATYRAFERACTHQGTNVEWEQGSGTFYCNNHGARFSSTGAVVMGPAVIPLRPITVSVAADGTVTYTR